jgi:hypothetical protein
VLSLLQDALREVLREDVVEKGGNVVVELVRELGMPATITVLTVWCGIRIARWGAVQIVPLIQKVVDTHVDYVQESKAEHTRCRTAIEEVGRRVEGVATISSSNREALGRVELDVKAIRDRQPRRTS